MFITGIRLGLFILSMSGYVLLIDRKSKIQIEFIPIIGIASITFVLFIGGLLNILLLTTFFLFGIGIFLLIKEIYFDVLNNSLTLTVKRFMTPGMLIFFATGFYFIFMLKNQRLIHYDNFSHWGLIVKSMLINNALPNFEDTIIGFNTYPPGSALYIYYFTKIVGNSEGIALIGQMSIILSGLLSLFSFSSFMLSDFKENKQLYIKKILLTIGTLIISLFILNGPTTIHNLLVDTLLNATGLALFALIYYYLYSVEKIAIPTAILVSFLLLIKNSGTFFGIIALFIYAYGLLKYHKDSKTNFLQLNRILFIPFILPIATHYLWGKHVSMVFQTGRIGKHTMSISSYMNTYSEKNIDEILEISRKYLYALYTEYVYQLLIILSLFIVLIILQKIFNNYLDKRLVVISLAILCIFLIYSVGLWIMYLVSMPTSESLRLAGYDRYLNTLIDFLVGVTAISILYALNKSNSTSLIVITNSIVILFSIYLTFFTNTHNVLSVFQRNEFTVEEDNLSVANIDVALTTLSPNPLESTSDSNDYYIYYPKEEFESLDYEQVFLKYRLYENGIKISRNFANTEELWDYDYLSVALVTDEVIDLFDKYSKETPKIGTYKIDKNKKIGN